MTAKELIKIVTDDGWYFVRQKGSHRIFQHDDKTGNVIIPVHGGKDIGIGLVNKILKSAGLK